MTETSISFRADAREYVIQDWVFDIPINFCLFLREYEEREYAFDLEFYADVIPEVRNSSFHIFDQIWPTCQL